MSRTRLGLPNRGLASFGQEKGKAKASLSKTKWKPIQQVSEDTVISPVGDESLLEGKMEGEVK